jgi:hypothetical protein
MRGQPRQPSVPQPICRGESPPPASRPAPAAPGCPANPCAVWSLVIAGVSGVGGLLSCAAATISAGQSTSRARPQQPAPPARVALAGASPPASPLRTAAIAHDRAASRHCARPSRTAVSVSSLVSVARGWRTCCSKSTQFLCRAGLEHPLGRRAEGLLGRAERTGGSTLEACPFQADHRDGRPPGSRSTTSADVRHGKCRNVAGTAAVLARGRSLPGTPVSDLRTADSGGGTLSVQRALARRWRE